MKDYRKRVKDSNRHAYDVYRMVKRECEWSDVDVFHIGADLFLEMRDHRNFYYHVWDAVQGKFTSSELTRQMGHEASTSLRNPYDCHKV